MDCVESEVAGGKSRDDAQRICAIAYQKKHGVSVQEAAKRAGEKFSADAVERDAELFVAGEYPDKGVTISEDDLDTIVGNFTEQNVLLEHSETPLDGFFGKVKSVWRDGKRLLGKLSLDPNFWALAEKAGARKLSIGLQLDPLRLSEVSLVNAPRVSTAQMFHFSAGDIADYLTREEVISRFAALVGGMSNELNSIGGDTHMADETKTEKVEEKIDFTAELAERDRMSKYKGDSGKSLGIIPDTLVIPPDLKWTAGELLTSDYNVDESAAAAVNMKKNILRGEGLQLMTSPYLTDTDNWYLLCTRRAVRPIIMQDRVPTEFTGLEGNSDNGFMRDQWVYGVRARYNVGYGLWQCAYGASV